MAQRATVDVSLRADISNLVDNLSKVEGLTKAQARKMVRQVERSYKDQAKAAKATAEEQIKAARRAGKSIEKSTEDALDLAQKSATEISGAFGGTIIGDIEGVFDVFRVGFEKLGPAAALGAGAATIAIGALTHEILEGTKAQRELARTIANSADDLEGFVTPEFLAELREFSGQIDLIDATVERMAAESFVEAKDRAHELELMYIGLGNKTGILADLQARYNEAVLNGSHVVRIFASVMSEGNQHFRALELREKGLQELNLTKTIHEQSEALEQQAAMLEALGIPMDMTTEQLEANKVAAQEQAKASADLAQKLADEEFVRQRLAERARAEHAAAALANEQKEEQARLARDVARFESLQASAISAVVSADEAAVQKAAARVEEMKNLAKALGDNHNATIGLMMAEEALQQAKDKRDSNAEAEQFERLSETIQTAAAHTLDLTASMSGFADLALSKLQEVADKERARQEAAIDRDAEAQKARIERLLESGKIDEEQAAARMRNVDRLAEVDKRRIEGLTKEQAKAAKRAFALQQSLALSEVAISGASAYMALLASMAYLGPGAPVAAGAIVGAASALQIATILGQSPPEFSSGGLVAARMSADHALIAAQPDEGIVSRRGIAALGGPDGLDQLNRGTPMGQTITANIMLDRQMLGRVVAEVSNKHSRTATGRVQVYGGQ